MSRSFILIVNDEYRFDGYIEQEGDFFDVYIGDTSHFTRLDACIHIVVGKNEEASLADLSYRPKCEVDGNLKEKSGTDIMLKASLRFIIDTFPYIERISLQDVAKKKHTNVFLTPKRLLLNKKGWYEERFGAVPTFQTQLIKRWLDNQTLAADVQARISDLSWGSITDLQHISKEHIKLIGTSWNIERSTVLVYPVSIRIENVSIGGSQRKSWYIVAKQRQKKVDRLLYQVWESRCLMKN